MRAIQPLASLLTIISITALGLVLRLYQLGSDSFWFDELFVAIVLKVPDLPTLLTNIRAHVMAMPFDYLTNWVLTQSCLSEACFRFPSVIWGTLTIPVSYLLFRRIKNPRIGLLAAMLLAVFPLHIHYSQELRFYASLGFFYILSSLLIFSAVERHSLSLWIFTTVSIVIGAYFHIYVLLVYLNGIAWLLISQGRKAKENLIGFSASTIIAFCLIMPGYLYFRTSQPLSLFSTNELWLNLLIGMGWLPSILFPLNTGLVWYIVFIGFQLIGYLILFRSRQRMLLAFVLSSWMQIVLVLFANYYFQYAFRGRQLLFLAPFFCLITAVGIEEVIHQWLKILRRRNKPLSNILASLGKLEIIFLSISLFILTCVSILGTRSYYQEKKSSRREISQAVINIWKPGNEIWTTPAWEEQFYSFYFNLLGHPEIQNDLVGIEQISLLNGHRIPLCWITHQQITIQESNILQNEGFTPIVLIADMIPDKQILWCRKIEMPTLFEYYLQF